MLNKRQGTLVLCLMVSLVIGYGSCQNCQNKYGGQKLNGQCTSADDCTGAALVGDCTTPALICCIKDDETANMSLTHPKLTKEKFLKIAGDNERNKVLYHFFVGSLSLFMVPNDPNEEFQIAAYMSQMLGETKYFRKFESGIVEVAPGDDEETRNETELYQGRGGILLRGLQTYIRANLSRLSYGIRYNLVSQPERAAFPSVAFKLAAWFWKENAFVPSTNQVSKRGNLNQLATGYYHDYVQLTHSISNKLRSLRERAYLNDEILDELKADKMRRGRGISCQLSGRGSGFTVPLCLNDFKQPYCGCEGDFETGACAYGFTTNGVCRSSKLIQCCVERFNPSLDIVLVLDSSTSIGLQNFLQMKKFAQSLLTKMTANSASLRVSLVYFNTNTTVLLDFNAYRDIPSTVSLIDTIQYSFGSTNSGHSLRRVNDYVLQAANGMRPVENSIPKLIVLMSDGRSDNETDTLQQAQRILARGFDLLSVGCCGDKVNKNELLKLSMSDYNVFLLGKDDVQSVYDRILAAGFTQRAQFPFEREVQSSVERNTYKYYQLRVERERAQNLSIELVSLSGRVDLFYSIEETNPKSSIDFVLSNATDSDREGNFVDDEDDEEIPKSRSITIESAYVVNNEQSGRNINPISLPSNFLNGTLYFSIKGSSTASTNSYKLYVFYGSEREANVTDNASIKLQCSLVSLINIFIIVWIYLK